ncbi:MAG TPA: DegQ family serine endoprotease [Steroidobacteraceae bacterium]
MSFHSNKLAWAAAGIFAVGAASGWVVPSLFHPVQAAETSAAAPVIASSASAPAPIALTSAPNYRAIVAQNRAAVVGVSIEGRVKVSESDGQQMPDLGQLFGFEPFGNRVRPRMPDRVPMHGQGSGFIISPDGLVLTNAHVVKDADSVTVKLTDHREFKAKVLGSDTTSDLAVLKIDAHGLTPVRIGNSDQLNVGDYVLAIGAPFGLEETATAGIVSAKGRSLPNDGAVAFIQTDAAVNPGNSGGPLFDSSGAVVGINSQIYTNSGGYQGVAFAIPINLAVQVESQIVKNGKVEHGRLGVEVQTLDQALADSFHLNSPSGALVSKVEPDSAAARAGIKPGDVILKYNGTPIEDSGQLSSHVSMAAPGERATLEILREGKPQTLTAIIGSASDKGLVADNDHGTASDQEHLGLTVRPLTPDEREQAGLASGLVVEDAEGRAAEAGIQQGDVVLSVNGTPVHNLGELRQLVHSHGKQIALLIQRGDNRIFVPLALG